MERIKKILSVLTVALSAVLCAVFMAACDNEECAHNTTVVKYDEYQHWTECSDCGEIVQEKTAHTLVSKHNEIGHWSECECGYQTAVTVHTFDVDGNCSCGYSLGEVKVEYKSSDKTAQFVLYESGTAIVTHSEVSDVLVYAWTYDGDLVLTSLDATEIIVSFDEEFNGMFKCSVSDKELSFIVYEGDFTTVESAKTLLATLVSTLGTDTKYYIYDNYTMVCSGIVYMWTYEYNYFMFYCSDCATNDKTLGTHEWYYIDLGDHSAIGIYAFKSYGTYLLGTVSCDELDDLLEFLTVSDKTAAACFYGGYTYDENGNIVSYKEFGLTSRNNIIPPTTYLYLLEDGTGVLKIDDEITSSNISWTKIENVYTITVDGTSYTVTGAASTDGTNYPGYGDSSVDLVTYEFDLNGTTMRYLDYDFGTIVH